MKSFSDLNRSAPNNANNAATDKFMSMQATPREINAETPKQIRKDSETFGRNTALRNHPGVSCESIDSSNMDLAFNKKKSTISSKKSRKESLLSAVQGKNKTMGNYS